MKLEEYRTEEGDMVDLIAYRRFGSSTGNTEAILDANPGLATYGPILPPGLIIKIPVPGEKPYEDIERLWS